MVTIKDVTPERVQKYLGDGYISPEAKDSVFVLIISCILLTFMKGGMWICVPFVILGYVKLYLPVKHGQYITAKLARKRSDHLIYTEPKLRARLLQQKQVQAYTHFKGYWAWELEIMGFTKEEAKGHSNGNGDTFVFYSPKAIDEKEAARQMKRTKQQLALNY